MSADLIKRLRDALVLAEKSLTYASWDNGLALRAMIAEADAHLSSVGQSREKWLTQCDEYINENQRLRAHIQQSANLCQQRLDKFKLILEMTTAEISPTHPQLIQRDFHLTALQAEEPPVQHVLTADWHDKPTEPGLWLRVLRNGDLNFFRMETEDVGDKYWEDGSRYFGPIPPDNASGVGECL